MFPDLATRTRKSDPGSIAMVEKREGKNVSETREGERKGEQGSEGSEGERGELGE